MSDHRPIRILVVTAEPDERSSSFRLRVAAHALNDRNDARVATWFLRSRGQPIDTWPNARDVDSLRRWRLAKYIDRLGIGSIGGQLRGARLRMWFRALSPDVVVLDDGLGQRLLGSARRTTVIVNRMNNEPSPAAKWEADPFDAADLVIKADPVQGQPLDLAMEGLVDASDLLIDAQLYRSRERERLGVSGDQPVVVGWGSDPWLDAPDIFIRTLWFLQDRHGITARGFWFDEDSGIDKEEFDSECRRCDLEDRVRLVVRDCLGGRRAADAVLLPQRDMSDSSQFVPLVRAAPVVGFGRSRVNTPWLRLVDPLDLEAAAAALALALNEPAELWWDDFLKIHDINQSGSLDRFLELVVGARD